MFRNKVNAFINFGDNSLAKVALMDAINNRAAPDVHPVISCGAVVHLVVPRDDLIWPVAADVCGALGIANLTQAVQRLVDKTILLHIKLPGGATNCITESGLYALVTRSRKAYATPQKARAAERNALHRLETAVRNSLVISPDYPVLAPEATQPKGTLAGNLAIAESCARMLGLPPSKRGALVRKVTALYGVAVGKLLGITQGGE